MQSPLISIISPIYNVENHLTPCIESALSQTYKNIELILVDDGSKDNCPQICDQYSETDNRIIVIHQDNGGLSSARNTGIAKATGDFIFFLDGDDSIPEDALEKLLKRQNEEDLDLVFGDYTQVAENNVRTYTKRRIENEKEEFLHRIAADIWYPHYIWGILIRRELYVKHRIGPVSGVNIGEDLQVLPQLLYHSKNYGKIDQSVYNYTISNSQSITASYSYPRLWQDIASIDIVLSFWDRIGYSSHYQESQRSKLILILNSLAELCFIDNDRDYQKALELANESQLLPYHHSLPLFFIPILRLKNRRITMIYVKLAKRIISLKQESVM